MQGGSPRTGSSAKRFLNFFLNETNAMRDDSKTHDKKATRRAFLRRALSFGAASVGAGTLLAACGGEQEGGAAGEEDALAACNDVSGLSEEEKQVRQNFEYVNETPYPEKRCNNCQFYQQPEGGTVCGGCQLFAGPVSPQGYCNSWIAMA